MSMKNSNDTIGNRTRDLLTCSAVPQPTALPCAPDGRKDNENCQGYIRPFLYKGNVNAESLKLPWFPQKIVWIPLLNKKWKQCWKKTIMVNILNELPLMWMAHLVHSYSSILRYQSFFIKSVTDFFSPLQILPARLSEWLSVSVCKCAHTVCQTVPIHYSGHDLIS